MKYTKEDIEIIKDAIKQYEYLDRNITHEIMSGATMKHLIHYVEDEFDDVEITNCDLKSDYKYIDFNYGNITCSIVESYNLPTTLSRTIEVWNDKGLYIIDDCVTIEELKKIIEEVDK